MTKPSSPNQKKVGARVAVVAAGVVSPLGVGLAETLESLRKARDCGSPVTRFSVAQCRCKTAGQVPDDPLLAGPVEGLPSRPLHRASDMLIQALNTVVTK